MVSFIGALSSALTYMLEIIGKNMGNNASVFHSTSIKYHVCVNSSGMGAANCCCKNTFGDCSVGACEGFKCGHPLHVNDLERGLDSSLNITNN